MQNIHLSKTLRVSLFIIIAIVIGLSCSEKIVNNNDPGGNISVELRTEPRSTALASVVNQVVLTVWADDMDTIVDSLSYDGLPLAFVVTVPAGSRRHFHVEAYRSFPYTDTSGNDVDSLTLIYEGSTITDIGGGRISVQVRMMAVVPLIRVYPHALEIPCGTPLKIKVEAFKMPGLRVAQFDVYPDGYRFDVDSISKGSSVDTPLDTFNAYWEGDWSGIYINGAGPLADANGFSHLATIHYYSRFFAGLDSTVTFSLAPIYISDTTLFDSIYYETSTITVLGLPDTPVFFPDLELTRVISAAVQIPGPLSLGDVLSVNYLSAGESGISDLTNIGCLKNIYYIWFNANSISDLSPLSGMPRLSQINVGWNQISDLSGLRNLPNLYELGLENNQITDLTPLLTNNLLSAGDQVNVSNNPLNNYSINIVIPALRAMGVVVTYGIPGT